MERLLETLRSPNALTYPKTLVTQVAGEIFVKSLSDGSFDTRIESVSLERIRCQKLLGAIVLNNREKKRWCSVEMTSKCS